MIAFLYVIDILFILLSLFLILLVLIQKGRGGGLSSAFVGGGGGHTAFGSKTGDVLTWATSIVFGVFVLLAVALNLVANNMGGSNKKTVDTSNSSPANGTGTSGSNALTGGEPAAPAPPVTQQ